MKAAIALIYLFCCNIYYLYSQGLTQSADGKSTIPIRGAAIGLDLAKTELTIGYNNLNRVIKSKSRKWLYGAEVKVKNEEGIGNLFSSGDLVPSGSGTLYAGITFSNVGNQAKTNIETNRKVEVALFKNYQKSFGVTLKKDLTDLINNVCEEITDESVKKITKDALQKALDGLKDKEQYADEPVLKDDSNDDPEVRLVKEQVKEFAKMRQKEYKDAKNAHLAKIGDLTEQFSNTNYNRWTIFGFGGITDISFKRFKTIDSSNLSKSFENIDQRGGNIGLGINFQWRNLWLGATYSYVSSNNFGTLNKTDYTLRKTTTVNNQALIEESKITGYAGKFGIVELNNFNIDIVWRLRLDSEYKTFLLVNPYLRASIFSRDTSLLPNTINLGSGFYFIQNNSKFLGGFYIELPDINNNQEKMKPASEQNLRPPFKRLSFGIVTKFNLSAIFGI